MFLRCSLFRSAALLHSESFANFPCSCTVNGNTTILVANGKHKAHAVAAAIEGPVTAMITASALQLHGDVMYLLDDEAASELKMKDYYEWVQAKMPDAP